MPSQTAPSQTATANVMRLVGYFPSDAIHARNYPVSAIPAAQLTHVIYAFADVTAEGECASVSAPDDKVNLPQLLQLKQQYPKLLTLISIGGAAHSAHFSHAAATEASRQKLAKSCVRFMKRHELDGIDIDWEFPDAKDKAHYTALLAAIRHQLEAQGANETKKYLLTISAPAGPKNYTHIDLGRISQYLDWINLMAYDFYTPDSKTTNFDAPLYPPSDDPAPAATRLTHNVDAAVKAYLEADVPADKLVVGLHFVGTGWQGVASTNNGLFQPNTGPAKGTSDPGRFDYRDISANYLPTYQRHWHPDGQAPWLYNPSTGIMITYDDPQSLTQKVAYVLRNQLGGVMIWQLAADDDKNTLLTTIAELILPPPTALNLSGVDLTSTVLANLGAGAPAQTFISETLNTALKSMLADAANKAGQAALVQILKAMPAADIAASQAMSLQDFVTQQVTLPTDKTAKDAVQAAIARISTTTTVGDLLGLSSAMQANPLFTAEVNKVGLARLLAASPALASNPPLIDAFITRYVAATGPLGNFWQGLSQDAAFKALVPELQLTMQLGTLTIDNPPLVAALRSAYPNLSSPSSLASLSVSDWENLLTAHQIAPPPSISGTTDQEKLANYATTLTQGLAKSFPSVGFLRDLGGVLQDSKATVDTALVKFLGNATDFDVIHTNLNSYLAQNGQAAFAGIDAKLQAGVTARLATWQRLARVSSDLPTASALVAAGFGSAYEIATTPRSTFIQKTTAALGSVSKAVSVHARAQQIAGTAMGLYGNVRQALTAPPVRAIGDVQSAMRSYLSQNAPSPNWQTLFGPTSFCACSDCRSIFSAAAYFVDLLQFLAKAAPNAAGQSPFDVLIARRPDLPYIKLSCANTNTTLPYVDLVNEILEFFVVNGELDPTVVHDTPNDATSADLSVSPEYTDDAAYNSVLNLAIFPPTLPFDRWLLTTRTYLTFLGSSLHEIMGACQTGAKPVVYTVPLAALPVLTLPSFVVYDLTARMLSTVGAMSPAAQAQLLSLSTDSVFQTAINALYSASQADLTVGTPTRIALACESLGISQAECVILTGADFQGKTPTATPLYEYYGEPGAVVDGQPWEVDIAHVQNFLQATGIAYTDLVTLLETQTLNPNVTLFLQAPDGSCDLTATNLVDTTPPAPTPKPPPRPRPRPLTNPTPATTAVAGMLSDATLDAFHRFIRLWRKLGWAIGDLDKTMTALEATEINQRFLLSAAAVQQLVTTLDIPLAEVLSFWSNLDTDGSASFYLSRFQNKAVLFPSDTAFQLTYVARLDAVPTLEFPSPVFPNLEYDSTAQTLTLVSGISDDELAQLQALSNNDPGLMAALSILAAEVALNAFGIPVPLVAPLAALPKAALPSWLNYDASTSRISFTGSMSDSKRQQLNFNNDPAYQAAIDSLYNQRTILGAELVGAGEAVLATLVTQLHPAPISATATSLPVKSAAIIPTAPFVAAIGSEQILVTGAEAGQSARFGTSWTVTRGYNNTTATTHNLGDVIFLNAITNHVNAITAALGISAQDLALIRGYTGLADSAPGLTPLNLANLSMFCRYAILAQSLSLSVSDLITAIQFTGIDPFQQQDPVSTLAFVQAILAIQASPFSIAQLNYLYLNSYDPNAGIAPLPANVSLLLTRLQAGLAGIAFDDALVADPKGDLLQKAMGTLLGASLAGQALGLITGTAVYSAPLPALLGIGIPPALATYDPASMQLTCANPMSPGQLNLLLALSTDSTYQLAVNNLSTVSNGGGQGPYAVTLPALLGIVFPSPPTGNAALDVTLSALSYDSRSQQLRFIGPMSTAEETALLAVSTVGTYQAAITNLFQQPRNFIAANFATFLDPSAATTQLIESSQNFTAAQQVAYVAAAFMPYLRQVQSKSLVTQTLCDNLSLSPTLAGLLLNSILRSQVNPSASPPADAMTDFLALVGDGLQAAYYPNNTLTGTPVKRIDPSIDFSWGPGFPDPSITARPFSVRWTGFVMPQYSEPYTFFVRASNGMRLWLNGQPVFAPLWIDELPTESSGTLTDATGAPVTLTAGQLYSITLEHYDTTGFAEISLSWSSPSTPKAIIPQNQLFSGTVITSLNPIINSYTLLFKSALLVNTFPLTAADIAYLSAHGAGFAGVDPYNPTTSLAFDLNDLPLGAPSFATVSSLSGQQRALFNGWQRLNAVVNLRSGLPGGDAGLLNIFTTASAGTAATAFPPPATPSSPITDPLTLAVTQATGWDATDFLFLAGASAFGLEYGDFVSEVGADGIGLSQLQTCMKLLTRLGISAQQLFSWASFVLVANNEQPISQDIQNTAKSKYDDTTWVTVGKPLNDTMRESSKEALIAYILARAAALNMTAPDGTALTTADQLYEFFLIDVEMSPCMLTSRIVQASAAVQLFVQRSLMNLELSPHVSLSVSDAAEWEQWRMNFRVWQAARQVFLYPEDWMVPSLRDDMTPFFKDFQNTLLQNPLTTDNIAQAYLDYLYALNDVALLDIRGTYWQLDASSTPLADGTPDAVNDVLHVIGRTPSQPYRYYYRRLLACSDYDALNSPSQWTPWESINVKIDAENLIPVVWDGRFYLFWPGYTQTAEPSSQAVTVPAVNTTAGTSAPAPQPIIDLSVSLNWSEYRQGSWSPKNSSEALTFQNYAAYWNTGPTFDPSKFGFNSSIANDSLSIVMSVYQDSIYLQMGYFTFSACGGPPTIQSLQGSKYVPDYIPVLLPANTSNYYNVVSGADAFTLTVNVGNSWVAAGFGNPVSVPVLGNALSYTLTFPQQFFDVYGLEPDSPYSNQPFFFEDSQRVYFVTEVFAPISDYLTDAIAESPRYSRVVFTSTAPEVRTGLVFPLADKLPPTSTASQTPGGRSPMNQQPANSGNSPPPGAIVFSNFFHPLACRFIKALNQYGLPNLLALTTQQTTNDGGVISGFTLSDSSSLTPALTGGSLYAQGQFYSTSSPALPPAPANQISAIYFNLVPSNGFYYTAWPNVPPTTPGDALIGVVSTNSNSAIVVGVAPTPNYGSWATLFNELYQPSTAVSPAYPQEAVDFSFAGAYSIYNWELFFHMPLLVATQLSQNQQFQDAQTWFHYLFNPTISSSDAAPKRYWTCLPFYECSPWDEVEGQIQNLFNSSSSGAPALCGQDTQSQILAWQANPFDPFLIGRMRTIAFRMKVVMAYLDNLIAWGDSLFAQNTRESINEATQIYVLAKDILGPAPVEIPDRGTIQDYTYNDLVNLFNLNSSTPLGEFSNTLVLMENDLPYLTALSTSRTNSGLAAVVSMSSIVPYFCFPPNDTLLGYWTTVNDRLYKIRHCMNIQGVVEQLPLFAPPISPALLVAAAAAGVDLSSVLSNTNAAAPFYRFSFMVQKALELCSEVRSLGAALLSALEKQDAEVLALLRATQETSLFQAMTQIKAYAVQDAQATVTGLQASLKTAQDRNTYYTGLANDASSAAYNQEVNQASALNTASSSQQDAISNLGQAGTDALLPELVFGINGAGGSPSVTVSFGGAQLAAVDNANAAQSQAKAGSQSYLAAMAGLQAQLGRRNTDWGFQAAQAADQVAEINAQIAAAGFRVQIAQQDQANLKLQIQNAQAVQDFLTDKYTNQQLYSWMIDQISTVYFQCYQMAYDLATRAEAAFRFERALSSSSYIQFGYWDSLKKGLMSGERLYTDLRRMEIAYLETDVRKYEIAKSISLVLFDPFALITLKQTGQCHISLPEAFFDMDYPGQYFRQIKTVSLTIPCVTGPYTSVSCTLTLLNSTIRVDSTAASKDDYSSDAHFITSYAATQSIATSTAQNDSGLFTLNFDDKRYLPFEGAGLISTWQIDMPQDCNAFDFDTITDVVLNLRYTSRYGGDGLRDLAKQVAVLPPRTAQSFTGSATPFSKTQSNLQRLFSLRHEFPTEWYRFLHPADTTTSQSMSIALDRARFPFQYRNSKSLTITQVEIILILSNPSFLTDYQTKGSPLNLQFAPPVGSGSSLMLNSGSAMLDGAPYVSLPLTNPATLTSAGSGGPPWTLQAQGSDVTKLAPSLQKIVTSGATQYPHLNPAAIDDIFLICRYTAI